VPHAEVYGVTGAASARTASAVSDIHAHARCRPRLDRGDLIAVATYLGFPTGFADLDSLTTTARPARWSSIAAILPSQALALDTPLATPAAGRRWGMSGSRPPHRRPMSTGGLSSPPATLTSDARQGPLLTRRTVIATFSDGRGHAPPKRAYTPSCVSRCDSLVRRPPRYVSLLDQVFRADSHESHPSPPLDHLTEQSLHSLRSLPNRGTPCPTTGATGQPSSAS